MKDTHDRDTQDMATMESSFGFLSRKTEGSCIARLSAMQPELSDAQILDRLKRYRYYLREKPYLAQALRRS